MQLRAGAALQADRPGIENACASGSAAVHGARDFLAVGTWPVRAGHWGGEDDRDPGQGPRGRYPAEGQPIAKEEGADTGRIRRGIWAVLPTRYFQRYGDQSDALAAIAAKNHKNGVDNPFAQMRKRPGIRFLPQRQREEPVCRTAAEAYRLLAWSRTAQPRWCWRTRKPQSAMGKAVRFKRRRAGERLPADLASRDIIASSRARPRKPGSAGAVRMSDTEAGRPIVRRKRMIASRSRSCWNMKQWG